MTLRSIRSSSAGRRLGVFDFTEDDELVEKEAKKLLRKFGAPVGEASRAVDKYEFLRCFAREAISDKKETLNSVIDIEDESALEAKILEKAQTGKFSCANTSSGDQQCMRLDHDCIVLSDRGAYKDGISGLATQLQSTSMDIKVNPSSVLKNQIVDVTSDDECERSEKVQLKEGSRFCFSGYGTNEPIGLISDDYCGSIEEDSTSTSSSADDEVSSGEKASDSTLGAHEIDAGNSRVLINPDFIILGDIYCTKSRLTFLCKVMKVEGFAVNATKEAFSCQWAVEDIIKIESQWCLEVETAIVDILLKSRGRKGPGCGDETSGIDLLKFAVYDPSWSEALEAIISLDLRYKDVWSDTVAATQVNACTGHTSGTLFTNPFESFEDIIYPQGDPDAVLISKRDIEFLQPQSFINDTIIDFYIKYLKNQIQPEEQRRFHFFNCFFFRKLANLDRGSPSTSEGREAFQRVQKWTKNVDLFEREYIFIPVNYSFHWSLIVICHPGEAVNFNDVEAENSPRVPCILHMDSIKGSHKGLKNLFLSYLTEEWKERRRDKIDDPSRILNLQFVPLELPQQENSFDCGLFLLHYLELFLAQAPASFSPLNISKSDSFLTKNWFPPAEASLKRRYIRELLYSLQQGHPGNIHSVNCSCSQPSSGVPDKTDRENEIEILMEISGSRKPSDASLSIATSTHHTETLPSTLCSSPIRFRESSGELPDLILSNERSCAGSYHREESVCQRFFMSPIEEVQESGKKATISPCDIEVSRWTADHVNASGTTLFSYDDCQQLETSRNNECILDIEDSDKEDIVSVTYISKAQKSSEIRLNGDDLLLVAADSEEPQIVEKTQSTSPSIQTLSDCVVEDSLELEVIDKRGDEVKDSASSFMSTGTQLSEERDLSEGYGRKKKKSLLAGGWALLTQLMAKRQKTSS